MTEERRKYHRDRYRKLKGIPLDAPIAPVGIRNMTYEQRCEYQRIRYRIRRGLAPDAILRIGRPKK